MKPLRFIHISKTGGQSIAKVAKEQAQIEWGMYDKQYRPGIRKSGKDDSEIASCARIFQHPTHRQIDPDQHPIDHIIPLNVACHILLSSIQQYETIDQYDWFMVVRNPYERFVSLYNWYIMRQNIPRIMRQNIRQKRRQNISQNMGQNIRQHMGINEYLQREFQHIYVEKKCVGCYFTEQYRYLDPHCHIRVLRYENIEEEFNQLMKEYGYNIVLNKKHNVSVKVASLADLTLETIEAINNIYEKDFTTFHYEMRHTIFEREESKNKDITDRIDVTPSLI